MQLVEFEIYFLPEPAPPPWKKIAINPEFVISVMGWKGVPTDIVTTNGNYLVKEDYYTVVKLLGLVHRQIGQETIALHS